MDLSKFDRDECFSAREIACLINGLDPTKFTSDEEITSDYKRILESYFVAFRIVRNEVPKQISEMYAPTFIFSVELKQFLNAKLFLYGKLPDQKKKVSPSDFDVASKEFNESLPKWNRHLRDEFQHVQFDRKEIQRWLTANSYESKYLFAKEDILPTSSDDSISPSFEDRITENPNEIDPADLPDELSTASIAFRAVTNGFGDKDATFKNRLIAYLKAHYPSLNNEAAQRIATVANPDKAPGRKKRNAE